MTIPEPRKIKVLVVDDSAIVRRIVSETLAAQPDIEVVGTAPDPFVARDKILALNPDVLTLDIEMPRMDGLTFLDKLMHYRPMPVIVLSSLGQAGSRAAIEALRKGAVEVIGKPSGPYSVGELGETIAQKVRAAASARVRKIPVLAPQPLAGLLLPKQQPGTIVAIGASTGGTEAIESILTSLPENTPGLVIVQHIPPVFSAAFASRLNSVCKIAVKEAAEGDRVETGRALIAPGDFHMLLKRSGAGYYVSLTQGPKVCHQRPAVDVLFASVAQVAGKSAVGALLTGMGSDGARGMLQMREAGAWTIAQDESSCVVFGMPKEAIRMGGASQVARLDRIPAALATALGRPRI